MKANQTLIGADGTHEVALFPMPYLYMTQDEGGNFSHAGTYNLDFVGYNGSSVIIRAPVYAPCTMKVVNYMPSFSGGHGVIFQSVDKVYLADGSIDYLTILFMHCDNPPYTQVGQTVKQGQLCYRSGNFGYSTGDHLHSCCGKGTYRGMTQRAGGNWDLANRVHYWNGVYVNDTVIKLGYGHDWKTYSGGSPAPTPPPTGSGFRQNKFPWAVALHHWPNFKR